MHTENTKRINTNTGHQKQIEILQKLQGEYFKNIKQIEETSTNFSETFTNYTVQKLNHARATQENKKIGVEQLPPLCSLNRINKN